jgi:hypothetical protein
MSDGIFGLTSPRDLLDKLMYDYKRLMDDKGQQAMLYTAYDFFVTAYSLVDWVKKHKHLTPPQIKMIYDQMIIKICADIANGSKHFRRDQIPKTTLKTYSAPPAFQRTAFQPNAFQTAWSAWVKLSPSEAQEVGVSEHCPVLELAKKGVCA